MRGERTKFWDFQGRFRWWVQMRVPACSTTNYESGGPWECVGFDGLLLLSGGKRL